MRDIVKKLRELESDGIKFVQEFDEVMRKGDFADCCGAIGVSCEDEGMVLHSMGEPILAPDEVLGKVAREVFKWTEGERDIADLLGASKGAFCRMCKHAVFGCCCGSEERRKAELKAGGVPEFCELFGRAQLFFGEPCEFFEYEGMEDDAGDDVEAGHCNQYQHEEGCEHAGGGSVSIPAHYVSEYTEKSYEVRMPGLGHGGFADKFYIPKSWAKKKGDSFEVTIPDGEKVKVRGMMGHATDADGLSAVFYKAESDALRRGNEQVIEAGVLQAFDDDDEKAEEVMDEWRREREEAGMKARRDFVDAHDEFKKLDLEKAIREKEQEVDERYMQRYKYEEEEAEEDFSWSKLKGSAKQVSWADSIRQKAYNKVMAKMGANGVSLAMKMLKIRSAKWWIDNRQKSAFTEAELDAGLKAD